MVVGNKNKTMVGKKGGRQLSVWKEGSVGEEAVNVGVGSTSVLGTGLCI